MKWGRAFKAVEAAQGRAPVQRPRSPARAYKSIGAVLEKGKLLEVHRVMADGGAWKMMLDECGAPLDLQAADEFEDVARQVALAVSIQRRPSGRPPARAAGRGAGARGGGESATQIEPEGCTLWVLTKDGATEMRAGAKVREVRGKGTTLYALVVLDDAEDYHPLSRSLKSKAQRVVWNKKRATRGDRRPDNEAGETTDASGDGNNGDDDIDTDSDSGKCKSVWTGQGRSRQRQNYTWTWRSVGGS